MKSNNQNHTFEMESSGTSKREYISQKGNSGMQNLQKGNLSLKMKIMISSFIGVIICLLVALIVVVVIHLKTIKDYKMEISDLQTEKSVLEFQKTKMNLTIINLTDSNDNLNLTNINLNHKLAKVSNEEIKRNKTYKALSDISKEGVSLKSTFSAISKGIEVINTNNDTNIEQANRELEENVNTLKNQLELINMLMEQISINLDLANQNKELLATNINITNQLNQQIINNTALVNENQNLIKEKLELNSKLNEQIELNNNLEFTIKQLELKLNEANEKLNQTCTISNGDEKQKIEELRNFKEHTIKRRNFGFRKSNSK